MTTEAVAAKAGAGAGVAAAMPWVIGAQLISGFFANKAAKEQARRQKQIAEYNAQVAMMNTKNQIDDIKYAAKKLEPKQRDAYANARMSVASRGGMMGGSDLTSLLDFAKDIQTERLELERAQDVALTQGMNQAQMIRFGGQVAAENTRAQGRLAMINSIVSAGSTYLDYKMNMQPASSKKVLVGSDAAIPEPSTPSTGSSMQRTQSGWRYQ